MTARANAINAQLKGAQRGGRAPGPRLNVRICSPSAASGVRGGGAGLRAASSLKKRVFVVIKRTSICFTAKKKNRRESCVLV